MVLFDLLFQFHLNLCIKLLFPGRRGSYLIIALSFGSDSQFIGERFAYYNGKLIITKSYSEFLNNRFLGSNFCKIFFLILIGLFKFHSPFTLKVIWFIETLFTIFIEKFLQNFYLLYYSILFELYLYGNYFPPPPPILPSYKPIQNIHNSAIYHLLIPIL